MLKELEGIGKVEDIQSYPCRVVSFSEKHLLLDIKIHHPQVEALSWYLSFTGVYYFEGPVFWTGAEFVNAPEEIGFSVWKRVYPDISDKRIQQITQIFPVCFVNTIPKPIIIAYGGVHISQQ